METLKLQVRAVGKEALFYNSSSRKIEASIIPLQNFGPEIPPSLVSNRLSELEYFLPLSVQSPWVNFINVFTSSFYQHRSQQNNTTVKSSSFLRFPDLRT